MTKSIRDIIEGAGGEQAIADRIGKTKWAVKKWPDIGIQDRYWDALIELTGTDDKGAPKLTIAELHEANRVARDTQAA